MGQPVYTSDNYGTQYTSHNREDDAGDYYVTVFLLYTLFGFLHLLL